MIKFKIIVVLLVLATLSVGAQVSTFDASEFIDSKNKSSGVQSAENSYDFGIVNQNATHIFNSSKNHIIINNFPINDSYEVNLILSKQTGSITDDAEIKYFKDGEKVSYNRKRKDSYAGFIEGQKTSDIFISYNSLGLSGYLQDETGQMYNINAQFDELNNERITHNISKTTVDELVKSESILQCSADMLEQNRINEKDFLPSKKHSEIQKTTLLEAKIAADGNFEFYLMFASILTNNSSSNWQSWYSELTEEQHVQTLKMSLDYIDLVMSATSRIYVRELSIILKTPYITIFNDPSEDPYYPLFGRSLSDKLGAMRSIWPGRSNEATDRALATVFTDVSRQPSGARSAGIAYRGTLCSKSFGFSALGTRASSRFPGITYSTDIGTAAHEFGHNFGAPHTHSCYWQRQGLELIDSCETGATFPRPDEQCLNAEDRRQRLNGTIMSYCHTFGSIVFDFHPWLKKVIRDGAEDGLGRCVKVPTQPIVRLIEPLGEEIYFAGTEINILYNSLNVPRAKLFYSSNLGKSWTEIGTVNSAVDTSFAWTLPMTTGTENLIRIESATNSNVFDQSIVPFIITDYIISPEFPKPNDKIGYLSDYQISWVRKNIDNITVKLSLDNGKTYNELVSGDINIYRYNFPDVATSEAILRIESIDRPDVSLEIPFELGREKVSFTSPMMNDTLSVGSGEYTITFEDDFIIDEFDILFRRNQIDEWKQITNFARKVDLENNEFVWTLPNDIQAGDIGQLRAEIRNSDEIIGESGIFMFDGLSGVNKTYSKAFNINSITPNPAGNSFQLVISNADERLINTNLRIVGVDGKEYKNIRIGYISTGKTPQEIDVHDLPVGTYYLMIESDKYKDVQQLKVIR